VSGGGREKRGGAYLAREWKWGCKKGGKEQTRLHSPRLRVDEVGAKGGVCTQFPLVVLRRPAFACPVVGVNTGERETGELTFSALSRAPVVVGAQN
jgi:hypothetical protein